MDFEMIQGWLDTPIIISIEIICCSICLYLYYYNIDTNKFGFNYNKIINDKEYWRVIAILCHKHILHLAFNMISLWNTTDMEKYIMGSFQYCELTFLMFTFCVILELLIIHISLHVFNDPYNLCKTYSLGYSGVLFGIISYQCFKYKGNYNLFGLPLPYYIYPFISLLIIQLILRNASFIGHLTGIIIGIILSFILNPTITNILFFISLPIFIIIILYSLSICSLIRNNKNKDPIKKVTLINGNIVRETV